jgi:heme/copper-type cytochrome/quinol oxidase subunit 2
MLKKIVIAGLLLVNTLSVAPVYAQQSDVENGLDQIKQPFGNQGLAEAKDPNQLIVKVINIMLQVAFGIALIFVIVGGYMYITAAGNEEQAGKGRKTITYALIGIVIIVMSYTIVLVVKNLAVKGDPGVGI